MATRGTYQFVDADTKVTLYVHWDNYLEGAAVYFYNMLTKPSKGNLATQFIRAVDGAEITKSHAYHGDTEYQYTINGKDADAYLVVKSVREKQVVFVGSLVDFIEKHNENIMHYKPLRRYVSEWGLAQWLTADMALVHIKDKLATMEKWKDKHVESWKSYAQNVNSLVKLFPELEQYKVELVS